MARKLVAYQHVARHRLGCGVDVVELPRFRQAVGRGGRRFLERIFTPHELAYAGSRPRTRLLHLAARFAAKEAVIKAVAQLAPGVLVTMRHVEIRNDRLGRPHVALRHPKLRGTTVAVSLSHVNSVAIANAIARK